MHAWVGGDEGAPPPISASPPLLHRLDRELRNLVKTLNPVSVWTIVHLSMVPKGSSRRTEGGKRRDERARSPLFPWNPPSSSNPLLIKPPPLVGRLFLTHTRSRTYTSNTYSDCTVVLYVSVKRQKENVGGAHTFDFAQGCFLFADQHAPYFPSTFSPFRTTHAKQVFSLRYSLHPLLSSPRISHQKATPFPLV